MCAQPPTPLLQPTRIAVSVPFYDLDSNFEMPVATPVVMPLLAGKRSCAFDDAAMSHDLQTPRKRL
ncbi:hypothetical protein DIPPA_17035, partial [Diplonema papillatum]